MILKFIKFGMVGSFNLITDFLITYLLKEHIKLNRFISNSIGFISAASANYVMNRIWTFESSNPKIISEYLSFIVISIIGLSINNFLLFFFSKKNNFYVSKLYAIGITSIWNFTANYFITFNL